MFVCFENKIQSETLFILDNFSSIILQCNINYDKKG